MSFNRSGYIGRAPGDSAITIAKQYFQPTSVGKTFTFSSGYDPGLVDVYRNGIKLINVLDYAATDGSTIVLDTPVGVGSTVQVVAYKAYNVATVKATELDTTVTGNTINLTGDITATNITANTALYVGSALTANAAGDLETIGIITAASFSGSFTGAATEITVADESSDTTCFPTFVTDVQGNVSPKTGTNLTFNSSSGALTATSVAGNIVGGTGSFSGAVNVDDTTDSTSATSGSLIVDGGLGVAKNVYIGAGLSVAGTLTYEDVTNVDSVGLITAKSGVNITGGELTVGSGITMGIAGVATFSGTADIHLHDGVRLKAGDSSDLNIYHESGNSYIEDSGTGGLVLLSNGTLIETKFGAERAIRCTKDAQVDIYYDDSIKFTTTNEGTVTTGISTATGAHITGGGEFKVGTAITIGSAGVSTFMETVNFYNTVNWPDSKLARWGNSGDLQIYHDGNSHVSDRGGTGDLWLESNGTVSIKQNDAEHYMAKFNQGGSCQFRHNNNVRIATTNEGAKITGFTSTTAGMGVTGGLFEGSFIKAGKLSDNQTLGISTANVFYFTTQETTTATPNIVWNDTYSLSNKMAVGDVASVTVITTAAAGGYSANWTIDGNAVTEEWVGGAAPSAGGADGLDIYSLTIIKTGTGTGDSGFKVIANLSNAT